jgi:hypothetical protein
MLVAPVSDMRAPILACLLTLQPAASAAQEVSAEDLARVKRFLGAKKSETIRAFVSWGPGNGHESATVTMMNELRQLGFRGTFEVVYDDASKGKLGFLIPGFNPRGPSMQRLESQGMTLVSRSRFAGRPSRAFLGITGGYNTAGPEPGMSTLHNWEGSRPSPDCMKVNGIDLLLKLQPRNWNRGAHEIRRPGSDVCSLHDLLGLGYSHPLPRVENLKCFLQAQLGHVPSLRSKIPGMRAVLEAAASGKQELLPVYGVGTNHRPEAASDVARVIKIARALGTAHEKYGKQGQRLRRSTVVPLLLPFDAEHLAQIQSAFPGGSKVRLLDVNDAKTPARIQRARAGQVTLVYVGPVSKGVFEHTFARAATLPGMVAGANATDLMQTWGRPYLNMKRAIELPGLSTRRGTRLLKRAMYELNKPTTEGGHDALARVLALTRQPGSVYRRRFAAQKPRDPLSRSKTVVGLARLCDILDGRLARVRVEQPYDYSGRTRPGPPRYEYRRVQPKAAQQRGAARSGNDNR